MINKKVNNTNIFFRIKRSVIRSIYLLGLKIRPFLAKIIPGFLKGKVKFLESKFICLTYLPQNTAREPLIRECDEPGINLIGYSHAEMGIGESCRALAKAIQFSGIPFGIINYSIGNPARMCDQSWKHKETEKILYNTSIIHLNANQMPLAYIHLGDSFFNGRYNIGYWAWELPDFPDDWCDSFKLVQEVWVHSNFILDSVSKKSPVPVRRIPPAIEVKYPNDIKRSFFKLPEGPFLFLCMYDAHSFQVRKNPQAVIEAFKLAFKKEDTSVGLVLKISNAKTFPSEVERLKAQIYGYKNIYLIEEILTRDTVNALISCTDCFTSLHRSEGFGLVLAEAMYLGKSVIGTNWSGNIDFMNSTNSCVVDYDLIKVGKDYGPYKAYQVWADPDIEQAAHYMGKLISDKEWREMLALNGQKTIRSNYSPKSVGEMIKQRLMELELLN